MTDVAVKEGLELLQGELRPYQYECIEHLWQYPHVMTADEMGIGKTVECIAMDSVRRAQAGPGKHKTLVVAPLTGVIDQWVEEFKIWRPDLVVKRINAKNAKARKDSIASIKDCDVFVIHPEGLRIEKEALKKVKWVHMIFDEVHRIKNRKTKTSKAAKEISKSIPYRMGATGTPIENRTDEIWNIFNWLYPDQATRNAAGLGNWTKKLLNSYWRFYEHYVEYWVDPDYGYHKITGTRNEEDFRKRFGPLYIRRLKKDVLSHLPPKQYTSYKVDLLPKQRKAYDAMKQTLVAWVGANEDQPVVAPVIIAQLIRLQQFTLGYGNVETLEPKRDKNTGAMLPPETRLHLEEPSIKLDALMDILDDMGDSQALVFSTSKQAINLAKARLEKAGITCSIVTGDITDAKRKGMISRFQSGEAQVMVSTIRAGGVGMNLQNCSTVIFLDRDWSPAKNVQAEDRVHRSGQEFPVNIIDIVAKDTIDQKKHTTIERKWSWIKATIGA